ncbi:hypothetical protein ACFU6I_14535 [Streptomyces sp. NPDC057486]|uniref:hypothetical protein n=1 Tax=Streptomyces sp. NPDC057486 TaxID=3346145 RepID=UPI0036B8D1CA
MRAGTGRGAVPVAGRASSRPGDVVPSPGTKTPKYLADNACAANVELSPADLADLDAIPTPVGARY